MGRLGRYVRVQLTGTNPLSLAEARVLGWQASVASYYAGALRVAMRVGTPTRYYLLGDHLGSTSITADTNGAFVSEVRYLPFGQDRYTSGTTPTTIRFTGQRQEPGLGGPGGLYFYNARWYDSLTGRFASADSIVPDSERASLAPLTADFHELPILAQLNAENRFTLQHGFWFQLSAVERYHAKTNRGPFNPQVLNRYAYGGNNPIKHVDPSGHCFIVCPLVFADAFLLVGAVALALTIGDAYGWGANAAENRAGLESSLNALGSSLQSTTQELYNGITVALASPSKLPRTGERPYVPPSQKGNPDYVRQRGGGYRDADGNIWEWGRDRHGGPHWDVQHPDGSHTKVDENGHVIGPDNFPNRPR